MVPIIGRILHEMERANVTDNWGCLFCGVDVRASGDDFVNHHEECPIGFIIKSSLNNQKDKES